MQLAVRFLGVATNDHMHAQTQHGAPTHLISKHGLTQTSICYCVANTQRKKQCNHSHTVVSATLALPIHWGTVARLRNELVDLRNAHIYKIMS
jgi:hypothetical protein